MSSIRIEKGQMKIEFGVTRMPNRKNKILFKMRGVMLEPLAYFRNNDCAREFEKIMEIINEAFNSR